jgi:glyoxylase-like metal-dependent hydrolase (beta-lactamase superfamily II)
LATIVLAIACVILQRGMTIRAQQPAPANGIDVVPVHGQVYLLAGPASNSVVQVGPQGVLVVDTMRGQDADMLLATIQKLAPDKPIRYIVNTHAHPDHVGGNPKIGPLGRQLVAGNFAGQTAGDHAFIFAHEKVLNTVSATTGESALPPAGWPTDTFFQTEKDMYFNGEGIALRHQPNAHTDGDILVFFRGSDVIAAGGLFDPTRYPEIDLAHGGNVNGIIDALNQIIDVAISEQFTEGGTRVVPGHGRICDEFDIVEYRDMVTIVRDRVQAMIKKGMTLEQIQKARPTLDWDPRYGTTTGGWTAAKFVEAVYRSVGGKS